MADRRITKPTLKSTGARLRPPTLPRPKAVIFDIGSVIVRLDPNRGFASIAAALGETAPSANVKSAKAAWELIRSDEHWQEWQEGRLSPNEWHQHLMQRLKLALTFEEFRDAWNRVLDPELILSESLFVRLADRCRLALLSNTDPMHAAYLEERFTFGRYFPVRIYSCRVGACKPSSAMYHQVLETLSVRAEEALYIDDVEEFVWAAREIGLDALQFTTPETLKQELHTRHLP